MVLNSPNPDLICEMLSRHGIAITRIEIGWGNVTLGNAITNPDAIAALQACQKWGLRPIILLNANQGVPCPLSASSHRRSGRSYEPNLHGYHRIRSRKSRHLQSYLLYGGSNIDHRRQRQHGYSLHAARFLTARFLEDRVPLVDIWPEEELLWGGIFANAKFATEEVKTLPRASELTARWNVEVPPDRIGDMTKVAVIWSWTDPSKTQLDQQGELVTQTRVGLRAFDLTGREILPVEGCFVLPFIQVPLYITTENLSVAEFRDRIAHGIIQHVTPVNLYALSLSNGADEKQSLSVRIENQLNRPLKGMLTLRIDQARQETSARFAIKAGRLAGVEIGWPGIEVAPDNRYAITLSARLDEDQSRGYPVIVKDQTIAVAKFAKRTINLTGSIDDMKGLTPVIVDRCGGSRATRHRPSDVRFRNHSHER